MDNFRLRPLVHELRPRNHCLCVLALSCLGLAFNGEPIDLRLGVIVVLGALFGLWVSARFEQEILEARGEAWMKEDRVAAMGTAAYTDWVTISGPHPIFLVVIYGTLLITLEESMVHGWRGFGGLFVFGITASLVWLRTILHEERSNGVPTYVYLDL